jgi:hypothetical protein
MIPLGLYRTDRVSFAAMRDDDEKKKKNLGLGGIYT